MKFNKTLARSIILGVVALIVGVVGSKMIQKLKTPPRPFISFQTKSARVQKVTLTDISHDIRVQGNLKATNRMDLFSEVNGLLKSAQFRVGKSFRKGDILISIDQSEYLPQLKSQKSNFISLLNQALVDLSIDYPEDYATWNEYAQTLSINKTFAPLPESSKEATQFLTNRNIISSYYNIKSAEQRADKYLIRAPYSGVVTEALIDAGALVRAGQKLGTFVQTNMFELESFLSKNDLKFLKFGDKVTLHSSTLNKYFMGTLIRINQAIDPSTQLVPIYISVRSPELTEGMYLDAIISAGVIENAISIDRNLIIDNQKVFSINSDSTLKLIDVQVATFDQNNAIITGLNSDEKILLQPLKGAFEGLKIIPIDEAK
jgi:multidrug efflux pump subunit AcrA (membrane-fusion protein)